MSITDFIEKVSIKIELSELEIAVLDQSGFDYVYDKEKHVLTISEDDWNDVENIVNHGIDGGYHGWIYYHETVNFYFKNKKAIVNYSFDFAEMLGENILYMIKNFNCLKSFEATENEIFWALASDTWEECEEKSEECGINILNAVSWFIAEETFRRIYEAKEEGEND